MTMCNQDSQVRWYTPLMPYSSHHSSEIVRPRTGLRSTLLFGAIISLAFGIAVLINPDLIADLVALFFIFVGVSMLGTWWRLGR